MKITKIETIPVNIPLTEKRYKSAEATDTRTKAGVYAETQRSVIVKIHTDEGIVGLGLSNPFVYYKESFETIVINIDKYFSKLLMGADPFNIDRIMVQMDEIIPDQPSSKNGVVTALYDIMGKALEVPICKLLGGCINEKIPAAQSIGFGCPEEVADRALKWKEKGVKAFKIKIGRPGDSGSMKDLKAVESIRDAVGPEVKLRVDANETYAYKIDVLRRMEEYDLDLIEQPAPRKDLVKMRRITQALDTPVLADQSIFSLQDAIEVIKNEAADVLMVKNYVIGGFYRAKQLLGLLETLHKANYVEGGREPGIGTAATLHLAASIAKVDYWGVLNGPLLLSDDLIQEPLEFKNGCWIVPMKPGLGVELDEERLKLRMIK